MAIKSIHSCGWLMPTTNLGGGGSGGMLPQENSYILRVILVHSEHKICDLLLEKGPFMVNYV